MLSAARRMAPMLLEYVARLRAVEFLQPLARGQRALEHADVSRLLAVPMPPLPLVDEPFGVRAWTLQRLIDEFQGMPEQAELAFYAGCVQGVLGILDAKQAQLRAASKEAEIELSLRLEQLARLRVRWALRERSTPTPRLTPQHHEASVRLDRLLAECELALRDAAPYPVEEFAQYLDRAMDAMRARRRAFDEVLEEYEATFAMTGERGEQARQRLLLATLTLLEQWRLERLLSQYVSAALEAAARCCR
jgi:hypothetical protein